MKPAPTYPPEFEREWEQTRKTGSKLNALKAWEVLGRPAFGASWAKWAKLDAWRRGFVPHVATWLNDRRFEQEPVEVAKKPGDRAGEPTSIADLAAATAAKLARDRNVKPATAAELAQLRTAGGSK